MAFAHCDYTVAWICALPLEMAAAKVMLDSVHPPLSQPKSDPNGYTLGTIHGHNVVVACLPSGVYGTTSAAIILAHMLSTFPSLQFGLMVGIGGGVPSETDIRLGDVVVSMPNATSGGVIQYDYGKTLRDGRFQRTGSLNKPPQYLLTAISQMRSNHMIGERPVLKVLSNIFHKHQDMKEKFSRPDKDWLFQSRYDHQGNNNPDCSTCDQTQLVTRVPRETEEPCIHYGLIASGNQVMKNANIRDAIAQEEGILCFEMEAAGLMDQLPCLVIRGICDYCDSHKHKQWQGYAAIVAAAYTRNMLEVIRDTRTTCDINNPRAMNNNTRMISKQLFWDAYLLPILKKYNAEMEVICDRPHCFVEIKWPGLNWSWKCDWSIGKKAGRTYDWRPWNNNSWFYSSFEGRNPEKKRRITTDLIEPYEHKCTTMTSDYCWGKTKSWCDTELSFQPGTNQFTMKGESGLHFWMELHDWRQVTENDELKYSCQWQVDFQVNKDLGIYVQAHEPRVIEGPGNKFELSHYRRSSSPRTSLKHVLEHARAYFKESLANISSVEEKLTKELNHESKFIFQSYGVRSENPTFDQYGNVV